MPTTRYKLWATGGPLQMGVTGAIHVGIAGVAKKATSASPFIVANEVFCNSIARSLLLPCPPGALIEHGGEDYFFSLNFNLAGQALPPIPTSTVVTQHPRMCWQIIAFDILVMNDDRHRQNIAYDAPSGRIQIFDHSHALLGSGGDMDQRLNAAKDNLAIGNHCLAQEIATDDGLTSACDRVASLPDYLINGLAEHMCSVGLDAAKKTDLSDFIRNRRDNIETLVMSKKASFPKLPVAP